MGDICPSTSKVVVDTQHFGAAFQQGFAQMRPEKSGATGNEKTLRSEHGRPSLRSCEVKAYLLPRSNAKIQRLPSLGQASVTTAVIARYLAGNAACCCGPDDAR
jgi:hypothetical protein